MAHGHAHDEHSLAEARCIHQVFEDQAAQTPDNVALVLDGRQLSYGQLNERANQFAHFLRKLGVGPGMLVGIFVDRRIELVVGLLGILKAGGAYVPIDPEYPAERSAFMLQDSHSRVIVTQRSLTGNIAFPDAAVVLLDDDWARIALEPKTNPVADVRPEDLAYVIYTSGSTGVPKGTLISHFNVVRLFRATQAWFNFTQNDVWTLFHSCAFDFSVWEMWGALFYGGKLVVVPFGISRTPQSFYGLLCREKVTVLNQTPSAFRQLMRADEAAESHSGLALRLIIFGGEALDFGSLKEWFERHGDHTPRLVNMYGITETTVHVTYRPISSGDLGGGSIIGVPIPDLQIHLLDEHLKPVPAGSSGEMCIGGAGVGLGYLNRPELTAQKFIADTFAAGSGRRLYRSGDLARQLPDGEFEYLGRMDQQVKIRGFRIELGEICAALNAQPGVRESAVIVSETALHEKNLVAYLVARPDAPTNLEAIRKSLRARLPEYMVPAAFVFIESLPITVNGKLDVKALPAPVRIAAVQQVLSAGPGVTLEQSIAGIWAEVLENGAIGLDENFFDVGGNSIHLATVHARLQTVLERQLAVTDLFRYSTIRSLAAQLRSKGEPDPDSVSQASASLARAQRQRDALALQRQRRTEKK